MSVDKRSSEAKSTDRDYSTPRKSISALRSQTNFDVIFNQNNEAISPLKHLKRKAGKHKERRKLSIRVKKRGKSKLPCYNEPNLLVVYNKAVLIL